MRRAVTASGGSTAQRARRRDAGPAVRLINSCWPCPRGTR